MSKENLKDKLDGNELDLSLNNLDTVPVKEIAALPKATQLDLSCNLLTKLPVDFSLKLNRIVKLDLSKNQLTELPDNIGSLQHLQTLDLFSNKLQYLPISFGYLKNLKWLDLKDNPLKEPFVSVAGDCLDDLQCRNCARNIVQYLKKMQSEKEREKQKRLKEEREREAARKAEEELERQKLKAQKKKEKERKREVYLAQKAVREREEVSSQHTELPAEQENGNSHNTDDNEVEDRPTRKHKDKGGLSCFGVIMAILLGLVAVTIGLYFYCESHRLDATCKRVISAVNQYSSQASKSAIKYSTQASNLAKQYGNTIIDFSSYCLNATKSFLISSLRKLEEMLKPILNSNT